MNTLESIVESAMSLLESRKGDAGYVSEVQERISAAKKTLRLKKVSGANSIIAEVKYSSPSSKAAFSGSTVEEVVGDYLKGGAAAISVLTEEKYFRGSLAFLERARKVADLPLMRKDFILDDFQVDEARAFGADGVLLIVSLLGEELGDMLDHAHSLSLWCLVEAHSEEEVDAALDAGADLIGINNRSLSSMKLDLNTTIRLSGLIPKTKKLVTESGINSAEDIKKLKQECVRKPDFYLVGTSLMQAQDRVEKLGELAKA